MWESLKLILNVGLRRDNIKTTFLKNVDNYIKTEDLKGNLEIGHIRRHFSRPNSKEIQLYRSHIYSSQEERKLYYDELKNIYKLYLESRTWLKIKEPVVWLKEINTGYTEKKMLVDPKVSEVMVNIKHARIHTDTLWLIEKNKRFGENVEIQQIVNKLVDIETRNRGISSMYIPKQKPTNIEQISTKIVNNITGSDASRIGLPVEQQKKEVMTESTVEQQKKEVMTESTVESTDTAAVAVSIETNTGENVEASSVVKQENTALQMTNREYNILYGHHFIKLIKSYNDFDSIPKQELEIIYKDLGLCDNGILLFNKIVCDAFSVSDYYIMCKVDNAWNIKNLIGIFEKYGKSINDYRFPNVVVKGQLFHFPGLYKLMNEFNAYQDELIRCLGPNIKFIIKNELRAKFYYGLKFSNGVYVSNDLDIHKKVDKGLESIFNIYKLLTDYHADYKEIGIMFEQFIYRSLKKNQIIKINNVCLHVEYMLRVNMFGRLDGIFLEHIQVYREVISVWMETIKITKKRLARVKTREDLEQQSKEIIKDVSQYQNISDKHKNLDKLVELSSSINNLCSKFYSAMIKVKAIVEKIIGSDDY